MFDVGRSSFKPTPYAIKASCECRKGSHTITVSLASGDGRTRTEQQQDLADGRVAILDTSTLVPGRYRLDLTIGAADGTRCVYEMQPIEAIDGPLGAESVRTTLQTR